jgi:hypothetical protein
MGLRKEVIGKWVQKVEPQINQIAAAMRDGTDVQTKIDIATYLNRAYRETPFEERDITQHAIWKMARILVSTKVDSYNTLKIRLREAGVYDTTIIKKLLDKFVWRLPYNLQEGTPEVKKEVEVHKDRFLSVLETRVRALEQSTASIEEQFKELKDKVITLMDRVESYREEEGEIHLLLDEVDRTVKLTEKLVSVHTHDSQGRPSVPAEEYMKRK